MNRLHLSFLGIFISFAAAWLGLVVLPYFQIGQLLPVMDEETGEALPPMRTGLALQGKAVYQAHGCVNCHTQQLRPVDTGKSKARDWGLRRTVARDYVNEDPVLLGQTRLGPDLTDIGTRRPEAAWLHVQLYAPRTHVPESFMPSYRGLYEKRKIQGERSPEALELPEALAPAPGYEIVPRPEAVALVAYLQSLRLDYSLPEASLPRQAGPGKEGGMP